MAEHSGCLGRWGRVKTEAPRAWPPALLTGTSGCPGRRSEPTAPHQPTRCGLCITLNGGDALPPASNPRINVGARGGKVPAAPVVPGGRSWRPVGEGDSEEGGKAAGPRSHPPSRGAAAGNTHPELREQPTRPLSEPCSLGSSGGSVEQLRACRRGTRGARVGTGLSRPLPASAGPCAVGWAAERQPGCRRRNHQLLPRGRQTAFRAVFNVSSAKQI